MFFFLSKVLTVFLFPLPLCIFLSLLFTYKIDGWKNKTLTLIPIFILWISSSFPFSQYLVSKLEREYPPIEMDSLPQADAIVILAGMINNLTLHDTRIELNDGAERLTDSILIYKKKKAPEIILTGGSGVLFYQKNPESVLAKRFLVSYGVKEEHITIEKDSRNTYENAFYTAVLLKEKQKRKIILVTSAFHFKRAEALFKKQGLEVIPFPTDYRSLKMDLYWEVLVPSTASLGTTTLAIKELIGYYTYKMMDYL
jgi:uncharacterized SAM-binding protein YcdF (DUF218 family)